MFWDSSALVPVLVAEALSRELTTLLRADRAPATWWGSPVECQSALQRRHRQRSLTRARLTAALTRLTAFIEDVDVVAPTSKLRERAGRVLAVHPLSAADAVQLGAALVWCDDVTQGESFVCLDDRLRHAARGEGFRVLPERPASDVR